MASAGRILIMPKGNYDANTEYEMLDLVFHGGASWVAKKNAKGIEPSLANEEYWMLMCSGTDITALEQRMASLEASFVNLANEEEVDLSAYAKQSALDALTVNMQNLGLAVNGLSNEVEGVKSTVSGLSTDVGGIKNTISGLPTTFTNMQFLSYQGKEAHGETNACSVTANFPIKVLIYLGRIRVDTREQTSSTSDTDGDYNKENIIFCDDLTTNYSGRAGFYMVSGGVADRHAKKSADGKTITWYSLTSDLAQLNQQSYEYRFLAIG